MTEATLGTRTVLEGARVISHRIREFRLHVHDEGGDAVARQFSTSKVRIGSREGNDLVLGDKAVSRIHVETLSGDSHDTGQPDPAADHTPSADNGVAGVAVGGHTILALHDYYYLESPIIDTAGAPTLYLEFYRWLNSVFPPYYRDVVED